MWPGITKKEEMNEGWMDDGWMYGCEGGWMDIKKKGRKDMSEKSSRKEERNKRNK